MRNLVTFVTAIFTGVVGFAIVKWALGATDFAARAGTVGSIVAMSVFFLTFMMTRRVSDGIDIRTRVNELAKGKVKPKRDQTANGHALENAAKTTQRLLMMRPDQHLPKIRVKLMRAGYFSDRAIFIYVLIQAILALSGLAIGILMLIGGFEILTAIGAGVCLTLAGWFGPSYIVGSKASGRQRRLFLEFPDALDLIVVYVESGNPFDASLVRVIETLDKRYPTVTAELKLLEYELRFFTDRNQAFENLASRCNIDVVSRLSGIIQQSEQIGSSIAEALKQLSKDSRDERFLLAERKAAKLPVIMQLPIVLLILPSLFLLILGPVAIKIMGIFSMMGHHH
jgi:tight adherence protein C